MIRRALGEVVTELAAAVQPQADGGIRVTHLRVDVPIEVALRRERRGLVFVADLPRWRWRSDFDREPGRLIISLAEVPVP